MKLLRVFSPTPELQYHTGLFSEKLSRGFCHNLSFDGCSLRAAQIMAITGHKFVQSLTTYQRVDTEEKIKMVQTLTEKVTPVPEQLAFPSTEKLAITAPRLAEFGDVSCLQFNYLRVERLTPTWEDLVGQFGRPFHLLQTVAGLRY
jgi:hypothetical protein